jgi:hypothetical protein
MDLDEYDIRYEYSARFQELSDRYDEIYAALRAPDVDMFDVVIRFGNPVCALTGLVGCSPENRGDALDALLLNRPVRALAIALAAYIDGEEHLRDAMAWCMPCSFTSFQQITEQIRCGTC